MVQTRAGHRAEEKRIEILRRAAALFRRKGFHGASMREIARGLDMAPGALYYYFASKEDLLYTCQILSLRRLLRSARSIVHSTAPAPVRLRALVRAHLGHILDELGGSFAHVEFHALPPERLRRVVSKRDAYERLVRRLLRQGIAEGSFRAVDVKVTVLALLGALNWAVVWWRPEGNHDPAVLAEGIASAFLKGLEP